VSSVAAPDSVDRPAHDMLIGTDRGSPSPRASPRETKVRIAIATTRLERLDAAWTGVRTLDHE